MGLVRSFLGSFRVTVDPLSVLKDLSLNWLPVDRFLLSSTSLITYASAWGANSRKSSILSSDSNIWSTATPAMTFLRALLILELIDMKEVSGTFSFGGSKFFMERSKDISSLILSNLPLIGSKLLLTAFSSCFKSAFLVYLSLDFSFAAYLCFF